MNCLKQIPVLFLAVICVSCASPYSGQLNVHKPIALVNTAGEDISLIPGTYSVEIRWKKGESYFEFSFSDRNAGKQIVRFQATAGSKLPEGSGSVYIPAGGSGQPWELKGEVRSKQSKTAIQRDFELCTLQRMFTQCSPGKPVRCRQIWKTFPGKRNVEFYHMVNDRYLNIQMTDPLSNHELVTFSGGAIDRWRVFTYRGECFWVE